MYIAYTGQIQVTYSSDDGQHRLGAGLREKIAKVKRHVGQMPWKRLHRVATVQYMHNYGWHPPTYPVYTPIKLISHASHKF